MTMNRPKGVANPCTVCDSERKKVWHLVCPGCWEVLPAEIQEELYAAYKEEPLSQRHFTAIREAYSALFIGIRISIKDVPTLERPRD